MSCSPKESLAREFIRLLCFLFLFSRSNTQLNDLYEDLVSRLVEEKRYEEAALILSKRLNRFEDAVATLCQGRQWHQAWSDAHCMRREDLIGN